MDFIYGFIAGFFAFVIYFTIRCLRSGEWDFGNMTNPVRALGFIATHFDMVPYLRNIRVRDDASFKKKFPFWYSKYDENKEVVTVIPKPEELRDPAEVAQEISEARP